MVEFEYWLYVVNVLGQVLGDGLFGEFFVYKTMCVDYFYFGGCGMEMFVLD